MNKESSVGRNQRGGRRSRSIKESLVQPGGREESDGLACSKHSKIKKMSSSDGEESDEPHVQQKQQENSWEN